MIELDKLITENQNPLSKDLDQLSITETLELINNEDQKVAEAVKLELPIIAQVVEKVVETMSVGGRLFLCGAGTSGRLAAAEAAECPPTFSTSPTLVQGIMAGAPQAFFQAVEGIEDQTDAGLADIKSKNFAGTDMLIGITASGRTPYVLAMIEYAKQMGATTALITANRLNSPAQFVIAPDTGPEVLTGSTRMKAATAAKMVLNMITTATMVALGKTYCNLMVDLSPNSEKLVERAIRTICQLTNCKRERAQELLTKCSNAKIAVVMQQKNVDKSTAQKLLKEANGKLRTFLE